MGPVFYVMAILGCGDTGATCKEARVDPVRYETVEECRANLPQVLARNTDLSFPIIDAACRRAGTQVARAGGKTVRS